jgi:hypothetical protein
MTKYIEEVIAKLNMKLAEIVKGRPLRGLEASVRTIYTAEI